MSSHANVLCFSKNNGKFLFAIDRIGRGKEEYTHLNDFLLDKSHEQIVLLSENGRYLFLDMDGHFLFDKKASDTYFSRQIEYVNDSTYLVYHDSSLPPEGYNLLFIDAATLNIRLQSNLFPDLMQHTGSRLLSVSNDYTLFYNTSDSIYDISLSSALYYVDFGSKHEKSKKQLRALSISGASGDEIVQQAFQLFQKHAYSFVYSFCENNRWLAVNVYENAGQSHEINLSSYFILFDKENRQLYDSRSLAFDVLNLPPVTDVSIIGKTEHELYLLIKNNLPTDKIQKITSSPLFKQQDLKDLLDRTPEDNPLIICLKSTV